MKVWRQAFSVQRVPTTLNAQPLQTLNLPTASSKAIRHASRPTLNAKRPTSPWRPRRDSPLRMTDDLGPCGPWMIAACGG
ncbi:MAG: hypothetical protein M0Q87_10990 [Ottowia sp.]|nr:hypothetical protein [Ottowia sp.]